MKIIPFQRIVYENGENTIDSPNGPYLWLSAYQKKDDTSLNSSLIIKYLSGKTTVDCLDLIKNDINKNEINGIVNWFIRILKDYPLDDLRNQLRESEYTISESYADVPQISTFDAEKLDLLDILSLSDTPLTYNKIGYQLFGRLPGRSNCAKIKYGENASRFAALLDLVRLGKDIIDPSSPTSIAVELTKIGYAIQQYDGIKGDIIARLLFRSVLFRDLVCASTTSNYEGFIKTTSCLSASTRHRRVTAFTWMVNLYLGKGGCLDNYKKTEDLICHMRH
jgi:hypothetical protein